MPPELFFDTAATARFLCQSIRVRSCPYLLTGWLLRPRGSGLPGIARPAHVLSPR
jgi:hypothetical protein